MTVKSNSFYLQIRHCTVFGIRIQQLIFVVGLYSLITIMGGCKKDNGSGPKSEYYIKFKANGSQRIIDYAITQGAGAGGTVVDSTSLVIGGKKVYVYSAGGANTSLETMIFGVYSENRLITPRTFNESTIFKNTYPEIILEYAPDASSLMSGQIYVSLGTASPIPALDPEYASITRNATVTITEYNDIYISGTFSGSVYQLDGMGDIDVSKKISLTEGEFKLKIP